MKYLILLGWLCMPFVCGAEYSLEKGEYHLGHTIGMMERGFFLGAIKFPTFKSEPLVSSKNIESEFHAIEDLGGKLDAIALRQKKERAAIIKHVERLVKNRKKEILVKKVLLETTKETPESAQKEIIYDLQAFQKCATKVLFELKHQMRKNRSQKNKKSLIWNESDETRADGREFSPTGVLCGQYLGQAGFSLVSKVDEIKILSAVLHQTPERLERIVQTFVVAYHLDSPVPVRRQWQFFWKRLSFPSAFGFKVLPTVEILEQEWLEQLKAEYEIHQKKTKLNIAMSAQIDLSNVQKVTELGQSFAQKVMR